MSNSQVQIQNASGPPVGVISKTTSGGASENLERVAVDTDQLNSAGNPSTLLVDNQALSSAYENGMPISCEGKAKIVVKTEYSVVGVQAELRLILLDFAGNRFYSTIFRPAPTNDGTAPTVAGFFHGEMFDFPVDGARQCNIRIIGQPGAIGNVSVWVCAI
jgi:hypothetical protein